MARRLSWSDVRGGVIAVAVIVVVAFATLRFARIGQLRGETFPLYANVGEARGLMVGSEVWLSGQMIGKVTSIRFRPPAVADTSARIEIAMDILKRYQAAMHRDAIAQVQNGGSPIGAPVMYMSPGSVRAGVIQPGDTVSTHPQLDTENAAGQFGTASREFPVIINNVKVLNAQLQSTGGTAGAIMHSGIGNPPSSLSRTMAQLQALRDRLDSGGTVGGVRHGELGARVSRVMSRVDSLRTLLGSTGSTIGRARSDSALMNEVADVRNELSIIHAQLDLPAGTAGRILHDSALTNGVAEAEHQMTLLQADIKKHPLRYIKF